MSEGIAQCMFEIGDIVIYGGEGVCRIEAIGSPDIPHIKSDCAYYTLAPLYRSGKTYTPVNGPVFMRKVISKDEAMEIIDRIPDIQAEVCMEKDQRALSEHYQAFMETHDCADLVQLIKTVFTKRGIVTDKGRKLGQIDERYMKRAEELLHGELAVALGIEKDEVADYIARRVEEREQTSA